MHHAGIALIFGLSALMSACASSPPDGGEASSRPVEISGLVIRNELAYPVTDVMIEVPATGAFAGCGTVLPRTECSNTFQGIDYRAHAVVIRWQEHGEPHQTDEFQVRLPDGARPGDTFTVEVIVFAPGQAGARLVEAVPGEIRNR
jgi:hypothetical protein